MSRLALLPLTPLYAAAVEVKNATYDHGWAKPQRLSRPVISVGNISVGGSGKTPFVICLAKLLHEHGVRVDVLSRGYGRRSSTVEQVDAQGDAERYGDEPLLIAQSAGVPVFVGANRYEAGVLAESVAPAASVHLLDDGFQHRRLARAFDLVLVHRRDLEERLLPAGDLREPLRSLRRASVLVLREEDEDIAARLRARGIEKPIWQIRRSVSPPPLPGRAVAFCGIARPEEFFTMLRKSSVEMAAMRAFPDHHRYSDQEIGGLLRELRAHSADVLVTTEKDMARLSRPQREKLASEAPLETAKLHVELLNATAALRALEELLPPGFTASL